MKKHKLNLIYGKRYKRWVNSRGHSVLCAKGFDDFCMEYFGSIVDRDFPITITGVVNRYGEFYVDHTGWLEPHIGSLYAYLDSFITIKIGDYTNFDIYVEGVWC